LTDAIFATSAQHIETRCTMSTPGEGAVVMDSDSDWMQGGARRWGFGPTVPSTSIEDTNVSESLDVGYEAALPGLQALWADATKARQTQPLTGEV
jgi:hypothetical protein